MSGKMTSELKRYYFAFQYAKKRWPADEVMWSDFASWVWIRDKEKGSRAMNWLWPDYLREIFGDKRHSKARTKAEFTEILPHHWSYEFLDRAEFKETLIARGVWRMEEIFI